MFSSFSLPFSSIRQIAFGRSKEVITPVKFHNVETDPAKSARTLKHLISLNHANHSIIYHNLHYHNHAPHILGTAYILGATPDQLTHIYEVESQNLEPWKDAPGEISRDDWRDFLGKREYQRAYVDFFEDQLVAFGYNWKIMMEHFLYEGDAPLINAMVCGLGHPLIHLGYAYELHSRTLGIEALALGTCFYSPLHRYIDDPTYTRPSSYRTASVLEILAHIAADDRFDDLGLEHQGPDNIETVLDKREDALLDHWNAWTLREGATEEDVRAALKEAQHAAAALVVATKPLDAKYTAKGKDDGGKNGYYDFFLLHALTTTHALRVLLPVIPAKHHVSVLRSWLIFALSAYIGQLRPRIDLALIEDFDMHGKDWKFVKHQALSEAHKEDAHFVKGLRALMVAEETWGQEEGFWKKAAVRMAGEFAGWGGASAQTEGYKPH